MNEYLIERLRRIRREADLLIKRAAELVEETVEVKHAGGHGREDS